VSGAATDDELGVGEFQQKYFGSNPLYIDHKRAFHKAICGKSLLSQPLPSWNPYRLWSDFKALSARHSAKGLQGNLKGEGLIKGGLFIIDPRRGVVYTHEESTGSCMPYEEIEEVVRSLLSEGVSFETTSTGLNTPPASERKKGKCSEDECGDYKD